MPAIPFPLLLLLAFVFFVAAAGLLLAAFEPFVEEALDEQRPEGE